MCCITVHHAIYGPGMLLLIQPLALVLYPPLALRALGDLQGIASAQNGVGICERAKRSRDMRTRMCMSACACVRVRVYARVCVCVCVYACVHACAYACARKRMHDCVFFVCQISYS